MAEFVQEKDCSWINIREGNTITDDALVHMEGSYTGLYGDVTVFHDEEDIDDARSFYNVMADHPRFREFLAKDCDRILGIFGQTGNPAVLPEFIKIFMTTLVDRCVDSPIVQEFEEFLDYRTNIKSANK